MVGINDAMQLAAIRMKMSRATRLGQPAVVQITVKDDGVPMQVDDGLLQAR